MRIFFIVLVLILVTSSYSQYQNLAPNHSFEEYSACPYITGQIGLTGVWNSPTFGSPDYFNICATSPDVRVPTNIFGYQNPYQGNAYIGIHAARKTPEGLTEGREYFQGKLISPLITDHRYWVSYYISPSEMSNSFPDQYSVYFSENPTSLAWWNDPLDEYTPQISTLPGDHFTDTSIWYNITGSFIAAGDEEYVIFGIFKEYTDLNFLGSTADWSGNYTYYDNICILDLDGEPSATNIYLVNICEHSEQMLQIDNSEATGFEWSNGSISNNITIYDEGIYWVKYKIPNECLLVIDSFKVTKQKEILDINIGNDTFICKNTTLELSYENDVLNKYLWNTGDTTATISISKPGIYTLYAFGDCFVAFDTIVIYEPELPTVFLPKDTVICGGSIITLSVEPEANISYLWNTGSSATNINISENGNYIITATNNCNEKAMDSIKIHVINCENCFLVPNAFTPNGDGLNDVFKPAVNNCYFKYYRFEIYNRWGERMFVTFDINAGWDGLYHKKPMDNGVYFYAIEAIPYYDNNYPKIYLKGDLHLLR